MEDSRESRLLALLWMKRSTSALVNELSIYPWDREHDLVDLSGEHIANALTRFVANDVSAADIEQWAIAVSDREDIDQDRMSDIGAILHELAYPTRTQALTPQRARLLIAQVQRDAT